MADQSEPFVRLARKFFRSDLWQEPREFSYAEAWLDLRHGEIQISVRVLSRRWRWSKSKVQRFLVDMENGTLKHLEYEEFMQIRGTPENSEWDKNGTLNPLPLQSDAQNRGTKMGHSLPSSPSSPSPSFSPPTPPSIPPTPSSSPTPIPLVNEEGTRARAAERSERLAEANVRLGIIRPKLEAVYRRKPLDVWTFAEMSALCEISKRHNAVEECEELLEFRKKPKSFFPKFLLRLLEDWTSTLDRARTYEPETQEPSKPLSILDLKTIVQLKEDKAKILKEKYCTEGPVSLEWADQVKRSEWVKLRQEIRKIKEQIERRA